MLVLPGADLDDAIHGLMTGGYANSGQTCICVERVGVHTDIWDEFVAAATERVRGPDVRWSTDFDADMGSLAMRSTPSRSARTCRTRSTRGTILAGGADVPAAGEAFVTPTLLTDTDETMLVHADETFGPEVAGSAGCAAPSTRSVSRTTRTSGSTARSGPAAAAVRGRSHASSRWARRT